MCGRYTLTVPLSNLVDSFEVPPPDFDYVPRFNLAPTQDAPVVAADARGRRMGLLRWGLVPSWAKDPSVGSRMINARSETVAQKPAFRAAFRRRRCLVPADGFFEWKVVEEGKAGKKIKVPHWIHTPERGVLGFAGLWDSWEQPENDPLYTFTILTTEASESIRDIHPRMPVILSRSDYHAWLSPDSTEEELQALLRPYPSSQLRSYPVSTLVNSPRNDAPKCIEPLQDRDRE